MMARANLDDATSAVTGLPERRAELDDEHELPDLSQTERLILDAVRRTTGITRSALTGTHEVTQQSVHRMVEHWPARD